jgi:hypothetical protein
MTIPRGVMLLTYEAVHSRRRPATSAVLVAKRTVARLLRSGLGPPVEARSAIEAGTPTIDKSSPCHQWMTGSLLDKDSFTCPSVGRLTASFQRRVARGAQILQLLRSPHSASKFRWRRGTLRLDVPLSRTRVSVRLCPWPACSGPAGGLPFPSVPAH